MLHLHQWPTGTTLKKLKRANRIILNGQKGERIMYGESTMFPGVLGQLADTDMADVSNFISKRWVNENMMVKPAPVKVEENKLTKQRLQQLISK